MNCSLEDICESARAGRLSTGRQRPVMFEHGVGRLESAARYSQWCCIDSRFKPGGPRNRNRDLPPARDVGAGRQLERGSRHVHWALRYFPHGEIALHCQRPHRDMIELVGWRWSMWKACACIIAHSFEHCAGADNALWDGLDGGRECIQVVMIKPSAYLAKSIWRACAYGFRKNEMRHSYFNAFGPVQSPFCPVANTKPHINLD